MTGILRAFGAVFFNLTTPARKPTSRKQAEPEAEPGARGTLLAIDDDPKLLETLRPILRAEGFHVLTAASGSKGLDMFQYSQRDVRLVVLDYSMPRLSGAETLTFLRRLNPRVKVLALTGVDSDLLPEEFRKGVDKLLTKPYTSAQLIESINRLLGYNPSSAPAQS